MPLYLSRVILDPRCRRVRHDLADCVALHRTVMSAFPAGQGETARAALGVLYRLEALPGGGEPALLVQAGAPPDWSALRGAGYLLPGPPDDPETKDVTPLIAALRPGLRLRFRLRANPTRRLATVAGVDGVRPVGKRVDLRDEAEQLAWLRRKGEAHGFRLGEVRLRPDLPNVRADPAGKQTGTQSREDADGGRRTRRLTFGAVVFEGELAVLDAEALRDALAAGIGPGKAYGFGLISLALIAEG